MIYPPNQPQTDVCNRLQFVWCSSLLGREPPPWWATSCNARGAGGQTAECIWDIFCWANRLCDFRGMKVWSFFMSVHEHAHEDKSAGYEQDSCAHAFERETYEIKLVRKSAKGHSWVDLSHKLCQRMAKDGVFGVPASCKTPVPVCHAWPCAIAKGLPSSSIFVLFFQRGAAWSSRRESWVSSGSATSRGMAGFSCHLEGGCLMTFFWIRDSPLCYLVTSPVLFIKNCPLNLQRGILMDLGETYGNMLEACNGCMWL